MKSYHETNEICFFCNRKQKNPKKYKKTTLYKETSRSNKSVRYNTIKIDIPRCAQCTRLHLLQALYGFLLGSFMLTTIIIFLFMIGDWGYGILWIAGFIGFMALLRGVFLFSFIYSFANKIIRKVFYKNKYKTKEEAFLYKPILNLIEKGWHTYKPFI